MVTPPRTEPCRVCIPWRNAMPSRMLVQIVQIGVVVLAVDGEQSPCARHTLELVFTAFDEVDA